MLELFSQFILELFRALLVEELSGRVRRRLAGWILKKSNVRARGAVFTVHRRNRARLLHRLLTEVEDDL